MDALIQPINLHAQITTLKSSLSTWEDFLLKTNKLYASLKTSIQQFAFFVESFQKVADMAYNCNCGLKEFGTALTRFRLRQRDLELKLKDFNVRLSDSFAAPLSLRLEEWRRNATQMEREYSKESRRMKAEIQRSTLEAEKWSKRVRRKDILNNTGLSIPSSVLNVLETGGKFLSNLSSKEDTIYQTSDVTGSNFAQNDLTQKLRNLSEWEQAHLKKVVIEERKRFQEFMTCLKPILEMQLEIFKDFDQFQNCVNLINSHTEPADILSEELLVAIVKSASSINCSDNINCESENFSPQSVSGGGEELLFSPTPAPCSAASLYNSNLILSGQNSSGTDSPLFKFDSLSISSLQSNSSRTRENQMTNSYHSNVLQSSKLQKESPFKQMPTPPPLLNDSPYKNQYFGEPINFVDYEEDLFEPPPPPPPLSHPPPPSVPIQSSNIDKERISNSPDGESTEDDLDGNTDDGGLSSEEEDPAVKKPLVRRQTLPDTSAVTLYPDQALPPPIYGNLSRLEKEAAKKFSLSSEEPPECFQPSRLQKVELSQDKSYNMSSTQAKTSISGPSFASVMGVPKIRDLHNSNNQASNGVQQQSIYSRQISNVADNHLPQSNLSEYTVTPNHPVGIQNSLHGGNGNKNVSSIGHSSVDFPLDEPVCYARTSVSLVPQNDSNVEFDMGTFRRRDSIVGDSSIGRAPQRPSDVKRQREQLIYKSSQTPGTHRRPLLGATDLVDLRKPPGDRVIPHRRSSSVSREMAMHKHYGTLGSGFQSQQTSQIQYASRQQIGITDASSIYGGVKVLPSGGIQEMIRSRQRSLEPSSIISTDKFEWDANQNHYSSSKNRFKKHSLQSGGHNFPRI